MIDGERSGMKEGMVYAHQFSSVKTPLGLRLVAKATLARMRKEGFAHLDPSEKFLSGFLLGVQQVRVQQGV